MSLATLIGHHDIQQNLIELHRQDKIPHAMLFHGICGVGKRLLGEYLARYILCGTENENHTMLTFNKKNNIFAQIEAGSCPDFYILEPEEGKKNISIKQVRDILQHLSLSADGDRVIIVDAAENMTTEASNALLKTLEEPGKGIHWVIISHNFSKLLPTIVSRCRQFRFCALKKDELLEVLTKLLPDMDHIKHQELALLCGGSPGSAYRLAKKGIEIFADISTFIDKIDNKNAIDASLFAEKIQKSKNAAFSVDILLMKIASKVRESKSLKYSNLYTKILNHQQNMHEFNLNPQLTLETSLMDIITSVNSDIKN